MQNLKFLKSFHIISSLPIQVFDKNFKSIYVYKSDKAQLLDYNFSYNFNSSKFQKNLNEIKIINGFFNELYIFYPYKDIYILIGPFRYNNIDKNLLSKKFSHINAGLEERTEIYKYLVNLKLFSLGDIHDIIIHLNYCITGNFTDPLSKEVEDYLDKFYLKLEKSKLHVLTSNLFDKNIHLFYYEKEILQCVKNGDESKLKELILQLSNSPTPYLTGDEFRSCKNYSITFFEKLSNIAINLGVDIIESYRSRDLFITDMELAKTLSEVLKIREAAIIYFTRLIGNNKKNYSPFITNVIQYISLNTYSSLKTKEIAKHFYISETCLRNKFKKETNMTLQEFITKKKIAESKELLKSNISINEIALKLGFFDASHFSKTFKNSTGITPKQYQLINKSIL